MAKPGPAPKPYLAVVREGNPSKREPKKGAVLAGGQLPEPSWADAFPYPVGKPLGWQGRRGELQRCRNVARAEWRRIVPVLVRSVGLADVDWTLVRDYCVVVARIDQGERALSRDGMLQLGERGWQKNGWTTVIGQYRTQLKAYIGELGLSPSSRTGITSPDDGDGDEDPFD